MISILMATYNGETYLTAQIDSLLLQTEQNFVLYVQDDCSTDGTYPLLTQYAKRFPGKIIVSQNKCNSGGAKQNFLILLQEHDDEYIMFCDQDDVWMPDKIEKTLFAMRHAEMKYGKQVPILVHTDLCVVDENLAIIHPSFRVMSNLDYRSARLGNLLVQNNVTGCTAMFNHALRTRVLPASINCILHDWWLAIAASAFGRIVALENEQTVLYRQHSTNQVGAKNTASVAYVLRRLFRAREAKELLAETYIQADAFATAYADILSAEQTTFLQAYCSIPKHRKLRRILQLFVLGTWKHGIIRVLGQILFI